VLTGPPPAHHRARLLVLHDEQPNLDLIGRVLRRSGYECLTLTSDRLERQRILSSPSSSRRSF